jgi:cytochrome oxidase Cu insertion factor (SCO1/SenC/PrrC family)
MKTALGLLLTFGLALQAAAPVPRPAGDLTILEPSGKQTTVASQKGKVVVIQFLFTWCPHCQAAAGWLSKMQAELGSKGLQVYGVAFDDKSDTPDLKGAAAKFVSYAQFPVGYTTVKDPVLRFLGLSVMDAYGVPQLVVIDKKGVIRAQTTPRPSGNATIATESVMREMVAKLLAEK